jgi:membrane-associated phospholipid phosphatase
MRNNHSIQKIHKQVAYILLITSILVIISYFYLDKPIAEFVKDNAFGEYRIFRYLIRFPELFTMTAFFTLIMLVINFIKYPYYTPLKQKLLAISVGLMAVYTIKDILKYLFSRTDFYYFHGDFAYGSFPSGHTTIAFFVGAFLWQWMPSQRGIVFIIPLLVGVGLLATNSHLIGDIFGGVGLGLIVGFYAYYFAEVGQ